MFVGVLVVVVVVVVIVATADDDDDDDVVVDNDVLVTATGATVPLSVAVIEVAAGNGIEVVAAIEKKKIDAKAE